MSENPSPAAANPSPAAAKKRLALRIVCIVLAAIFLVVAVLAISFTSVWRNEISTVSSFKHLRARNDENK